MKSILKLVYIALFVFTSSVSFCQNKDTSNVNPKNIEYAFLNYNTGLFGNHLDVFYSNGQSENLKELLNLNGATAYKLYEDSYYSLNKAFQYLNSKGYELISSSVTENKGGAFYREYIFGKKNP